MASAHQRVQQWMTFARTWWLYDARGQCPFQSADKLVTFLKGQHKPIYHPLSDLGDHIVVTNTKHVALPDRLWRTWRYFSHLGVAGTFRADRAWQVHERDPTEILYREVKARIEGNLLRPALLARLHLYADDAVPEEIMRNVTDQIRQVQMIPKRLEDYTKEELENFPQLFDWPKDHVLVRHQSDKKPQQKKVDSASKPTATFAKQSGKK